MGANGFDPLQAAIEQSKQEQQAREMLGMMLQQTMVNPAVVKTAMTSMTGVVDEGPTGRMLRVALPNGERWDIPVSPQAQEALARALTAPVAEAA